jgi:TPR repeat protein
MVNVGNCYFQGSGVQADLDEAMRWYDQAAAQGSENAIFMRDQLREKRLRDSSGLPDKPKERFLQVTLDNQGPADC